MALDEHDLPRAEESLIPLLQARGTFSVGAAVANVRYLNKCITSRLTNQARLIA